MTWRYQIVRYRDGDGYGLHEVHYGADGKPVGMTERAVGFVGDSPDDVRQSLTRALVDAVCGPVVNEPIEWPAPNANEK